MVYTKKGVIKICFQKKKKINQKKWTDSVPWEIAGKLDCYLNGESQSLDIKIDWRNIEGTAFQKQVWKKIKQIPYGQTKTYGGIARLIKKPEAFRAVGTACGKNPLLLVVPCHRVVAVKGLGGFSGGGLNIKENFIFLKEFIFKHGNCH